MEMRLRLLGAAGSTVMILPIGASGATIGGATTHGSSTTNGWPLTSNDLVLSGSPAFYLSATGASAQVAMLFAYVGAGASLQ